MSGQVPESNPRTDDYQNKKDNDIKGKCDSNGPAKTQWYNILVATRSGKTVVFYEGWTKLTVRYSQLRAEMYESKNPEAEFQQLCKDIGLNVDYPYWTKNEYDVPMVECRIKEYGKV